MTPQLPHLMAEYNCYMNAQIYDAAAKLSLEELQADKGAFFGSIFGTLNHICAADTIWLNRFAQVSTVFPALDGLAAYPNPTSLRQAIAPDFAGLRNYRVAIDTMIGAWAHELTPERLASSLTYTDMAGTRSTKVLGALVQHFFNHQTHHRGQVTTLLSQYGVDVGVTDLLMIIPNIDAF